MLERTLRRTVGKGRCSRLRFIRYRNFGETEDILMINEAGGKLELITTDPFYRQRRSLI